MNERIVIKRFNEVIYDGKILEMPMKESAIIEKSVEVFGDADPCIIHRSFVKKDLVQELLYSFKGSELLDYSATDLDILDFERIDGIFIEVVA